MTLVEIVAMLKDAHRHGDGDDSPEGKRWIQISATLADEVVKELTAYRDDLIHLCDDLRRDRDDAVRQSEDMERRLDAQAKTISRYQHRVDDLERQLNSKDFVRIRRSL